MPPYDPKWSIAKLEDEGTAYLRHWTALLSVELASLQETATQQKLFQISIIKYDRQHNLTIAQHGRETWKVLIPGIREDTPRIQTGDILILRGLYPDLKTADKRAIQARVSGYIKRDGVVFVESPELETHAEYLPRDAKGNVQWVVEFKASSEAICIMQNAVRFVCFPKQHIVVLSIGNFQVRSIACHYEAAQATSPDELPRRVITKRWLFPEIQDVSLSTKSTMSNNQQLYDRTLNTEQREAVSSVVEGRHRVPYLISGPPGVSHPKLFRGARA